ncbi:MAG: hypothetical protein FGF52_00550 [Candidatus Brockarchaeota archaeon]|nr:hypothetical protein [Candidatus Brockarchaeota archaeon]
MNSEENAGETTLKKKLVSGGKMLNLLPGIILAAAYFSASIFTIGEAYNLIVAGALIGASLCIRCVSDTAFKRVVRYMFLTGITMGVAGVSPPLYFAIVQGIISSTELILSVICIILTVITLAIVRHRKML